MSFWVRFSLMPHEEEKNILFRQFNSRMEELKDHNSVFQIQRFSILVLCCLIYIIVFFHRVCLAVLSDELTEKVEGVTLDKLGILSSVYFWLYSLFQIPGGMVADILGSRLCVAMAAFVTALGAIVMGFSNSYGMLVVGRVFVGIGVSFVFVPISRFNVVWWPKKKFGLMTSVMLACGGLGGILATVPLKALVDAVGYRWTFWIIGFADVIAAVLLFVLARDYPEQMNWKPVNEETSMRKMLQIESPTISKEIVHKAWVASIKRSAKNLPIALKTILSSKFFWPVVIFIFFTNCNYFALSSLWGKPFAEDVYGFSTSQSASLLLMLPIGMLIGTPIVDSISSNILKSRKVTIIIFGFVNAVSFWFMTIWGNSLPDWLLYVLFFVFAIGCSDVICVCYTNVKELFPPNIATTANGVFNVFPFLGSAILQSVLSKIIALGGETYDSEGEVVYTPEGYSYMWMTLAILASISCIFSPMIKETHPDRIVKIEEIIDADDEESVFSSPVQSKTKEMEEKRKSIP
ncbi:putative multi-domain containing protein [Aduncisulcus paluster]|uniref:Lysosomal dipeptide transporter MFSD1 n=1 Tax=Aduncisulcus paluster TaxID=2918883 RepID=A0ABQ5KJZ5_9EUKA|nr:putative multi-domain containing protein [Aduncisulcus paluster]